MSIYSIIFRLAPAVGAVLLGALADVIGLDTATLILPTIALIALALLWRPFLSGVKQD